MQKEMEVMKKDVNEIKDSQNKWNSKTKNKIENINGILSKVQQKFIQVDESF